MPRLARRASHERSGIASSDQTVGTGFTRSRDWMQDKLAKLQLQLELDADLTRFQPPQVSVMDAEDGNLRVVLLTTPALYWKHQAIESGYFGALDAVARRYSAFPSHILQGTNFRVSERYRCLADSQGQVQGGVGFIYEGEDVNDGSQVAVKFFHKAGDDDAASERVNMELVTCMRLYHGLHSTCIDQDDERDLNHVARLRDVLIDAPIYDEAETGLATSVFRATALVFDWADGGDAHSLVRERGGLTPTTAARLFKQVLRGIRCLHRRGIVHRDIKPENILLAHDSQTASLCDFGFAKHVPSTEPEDLAGDPTTCYQSPERWLACHSRSAQRSRSRAASGVGVGRRDETSSSLFASDIFSAGVSLFILVGYHAILNRLMAGDARGDAGEADESGVPALNIFQHTPGGDMFGLLQAGPRVGGVQGRLWAYWDTYGLKLPLALRGLLDGLLHPVPDHRFTMNQAFAWIESHPEMFGA